MTTKPRPICPFCSLLCPVLPNGRLASSVDCPKRQQGLKAIVGQHDVQASNDFRTVFSRLIAQAQRPLIWIDGTDVSTLRAAVQLAETWPATIHIASGQGAKVCNQVSLAEGWFSTTLPEVIHHSRLIVALGSSWMHELPVLRHQLEQHLSADVPVWLIASDVSAIPRPDAWRCIDRPREEWYALFTELCLARDPDQRSLVSELSRALRNSPNTTILWENSLWTDEQDQVIVHQVMTLAKQLNRQSRCNLLALDADAGAHTAGDALLWLTGCHQTAAYDCNWTTPKSFLLEDPLSVRDHFDAVVQICDTPSSRLTQSLTADLVLACAGQSERSGQERFIVAAAGSQRDAILFRGDHGLTCFASASDHSMAARSLPTTAELLDQARTILIEQGAAGC